MTNNRVKLGRSLCVVIVVVAAAILLTTRIWKPSLQPLLANARRELARGNLDEAHRLAMRSVEFYPQSQPARLLAADVELSLNRPAAALFQLEQVVDDGSPKALMAIGNAGDLFFQRHELTKAAARFHRVLALNSRHLLAKKRLAQLYALTGRRLDAVRMFLEIVQSGQFDTHELALLGEWEQVFENPELTAHLAQLHSDDPWQTRAAARLALFRHESTKALELFRRLVAEQPDDIDLQVGIGRALVDTASDEEFLRWHRALSPKADQHPDIWDVRGRYAQRRSESAVAVRCYLEAVRRDPNLRHSHYQLAGLLHRSGDTERSRRFQERSDQLNSLSETLGLIHVESARPELLERAGRLCSALGRAWETWGWLQATASVTGQVEFRAQADRLIQTFPPDTPLVLPDGHLASLFDLEKFPLPNWTPPGDSETRHLAIAEPRRTILVKFEDMAQSAGLEFTYFNGHPPNAAGMQIWEGPGGGVGVIDFDQDSWPDLYFPQGSEWPPQPGQTRYLDRLFRNQGDGRFTDVTEASGLGDERYSHGVAVGDYDADGFPDLYITNIGENRLYRNCGDGTFLDVTSLSGISGEGWSTSSLMADLNADGYPEIYDVRYLSGREPFLHVCHDKERNNAPRTCSPAVFQAQQDRLFLNRGDGTFADISEEAGILAPEGKGLGIVAGDFDGSGRLSLFVANDTTANFLFVNQTVAPGAAPRFVEQAILAGCAFDNEGKAQASMGVAADDADGDGLTDLFVTNFFNEYNVLYRQMPGGVFVDVSSSARLKEPSLAMLGFGTQFLDGDLDGWPDLVVANGHVDDFSSHGIPFRMRAQYFANRGQGRFDELPAEQLGGYFQQKLLGRGLARVDWNRDGREDFVVSNLDTPVNLVTNRTVGAGHFLALQLRGVASNRDAIGSVVRITVGGQSRSKQLTAGDGYLASNQRQLVFGMGDRIEADTLSIRWPSGLEQTFRNVGADREYLALEGRDELISLRK
jgi:tetratricopeptide (TPR) repeat protein